MAPVDAVEPSHVDPVLAEKLLQRFARTERSALPFYGRIAWIDDAAEIPILSSRFRLRASGKKDNCRHEYQMRSQTFELIPQLHAS